MDNQNTNLKGLESLLRSHLQQDANRLDRIEEKIDKLSDTVVALARAEEKLISLEANKQEVIKRLDEHEIRLDKHAERLNQGAVTLNTISKLFWIVVTSVVGIIAVYLGAPK